MFSINGASAAVTGAATVGGTLGVTGNTTLSADLDGVNADFSGTLNVSGDTTVNNLIVNGTSTISTMAISGGSVDGSVIGATTPAAGSFTDLSATKLTGALNANDQAITNINVDSGSIDGVAIGANSASTASVTSLDIAGDVTVSGSHVIDMGANKLTNVADPTSAQDAATKSYIESVIDTLNQKKSVKAATTQNIVATYTGTDTLTVTSTGVFVSRWSNT